MYGFDAAGSLAEETANPRRNAPRAILQALGAAGVLGFLLLLGALMAAPDLTAAGLGRIDGGLPSIVIAALGGTVGLLLLGAVIFAIVVCALAVHAGAVRLVFAMARDQLLPFSRALASVSPVSKTPVLPVLVIGAAAMAILAANINLPKLVELVTMIAVLLGQPGLPDRDRRPVATAPARMARGLQPGRGQRRVLAQPVRHPREHGRSPVELVHGGERRLAARGGLRRGLANPLRADHPHDHPRRHGHRRVRIGWRGGARRSCRRSQICDRINS